MLVRIGVVPDGQRRHYEVEKGCYGTAAEPGSCTDRVVRFPLCEFLVVLRNPNQPILFPPQIRLQSRLLD